jgi:Protein of unknown function (DUF3106)
MTLRGLSLWAAGLALALAGAAWGAGQGTNWASLTPAQRQVLSPLQRDWSSIDANQREKWVEVAARFPTMPAEERQRLQARMAEWVSMTPAQRATARLQFQEVKRLPAEERQERWKAYQALSPEERGQLAQRAKPAARAASSAPARGTAEANSDDGKRNIVAAPAAARSRVVAPTVVQARPGATTTTMTTRAAPPLHHQAGLPKIAATPGFVDPETLLPQRGPQGAAVRSAPPPERTDKQ